MTDREIHIGEIIRRRLKENERTVSWLARKLHCDRSNIYKIFEKKSIDIEQLQKISEIMDYNFFEIYSRNFNERRVDGV